MPIGRFKIICHTCEGKKEILEKSYPERTPIQVICYECNGDGYVYADAEYKESEK